MSRFPIILATTALVLIALGWWSIDKLKQTLAEKEAAAQTAIPAEILLGKPAKKAGTPDPAPDPEPGAQHRRPNTAPAAIVPSASSFKTISAPVANY